MYTKPGQINVKGIIFVVWGTNKIWDVLYIANNFDANFHEDSYFIPYSYYSSITNGKKKILFAPRVSQAPPNIPF
jgi:hypothetical protein